uniref:Uncharacterized protein n=1 Tax=Knipowitschia caucasica TaxID=637954 RepID=A0AAV2M7Z1_KNICA
MASFRHFFVQNTPNNHQGGGVAAEAAVVLCHEIDVDIVPSPGKRPASAQGLSPGPGVVPGLSRENEDGPVGILELSPNFKETLQSPDQRLTRSAQSTGEEA